MANLAIVGSHSTNGVAAIHSGLLRRTTVKDLAEMYPERFNNKTNGVTPRRWLLLANPALSPNDHQRPSVKDGLPTWPTEQAQETGRRQGASHSEFRQGQARSEVEVSSIGSRRHPAQTVDPDSIFDCQVKRIHEYKRQLLNALRIVVLYNRLRETPNLEDVPADILLCRQGGAGVPLGQGDHQVHQQSGRHHRRRSVVRGRLKVVFLPDYCVSLAERLIPATDVSNQISTAGYEASGTSNMKFMMNGALTLGTRDGATIEMAEEAGEENFFLFGLDGGPGGRQSGLVQSALAL